MKVVLNRCYGGFALSKAAYEELGMEWDGYGYAYDEDRSDHRLVAAVEKLGEKANGECSRLVVEDVDAPVMQIHSHDGMESVRWVW
jgi:hypothetical protein